MTMPLSASSCSVLLACWKFSSHSYIYQHPLTYFRHKESGQLQCCNYYTCLCLLSFDRGGMGSAQTSTRGGTPDLQHRQAASNGSDFGSRDSHRLQLLSRATLWIQTNTFVSKEQLLFIFWKWHNIWNTQNTRSIPNPEDHMKTCFLYFTLVLLGNNLLSH